MALAFGTAWLRADRSLLNEILWPEYLGYTIGVMFIPFVLAWLIYGRKKKWGQFSKWFLLLTLITYFLSSSQSKKAPYNANDAMATLLKQAAGTAPPSDRTAAETSFRQWFQEVLTVGNSYRSVSNGFFAGDGKLLLKPDSYSSKEAIQQAKQGLESVLNSNHKVEEFLEKGALETARQRVNKLDWSEGDKNAFLVGMQSTYNAAPSKNALNAEAAWLQSCIDLYDFVDEHFSEVEVKDHQAHITNNEVRLQFNDRIQHVNQLAEAMDAASAEQQKALAKTQSQFGVRDDEIHPK